MADDRLARIEACGVVAVVRLDDLVDAVPLAYALVDGGIEIIEFTLTNPRAIDAIKTVKAALGTRCLVGAGSVVTAEQVEMVGDAGAAFVVSPVCSQVVIMTSRSLGMLVIPGAYTPTEIQYAWELGASVVKVFPARSLTPHYIKDVLAPLPHLRLMPTGGIDLANAEDYIGAGAFAIGVGGSLIDKDCVASRDWATLSKRAHAFVEVIHDARQR